MWLRLEAKDETGCALFSSEEEAITGTWMAYFYGFFLLVQEPGWRISMGFFACTGTCMYFAGGSRAVCGIHRKYIHSGASWGIQLRLSSLDVIRLNMRLTDAAALVYSVGGYSYLYHFTSTDPATCTLNHVPDPSHLSQPTTAYAHPFYSCFGMRTLSDGLKGLGHRNIEWHCVRGAIE